MGVQLMKKYIIKKKFSSQKFSSVNACFSDVGNLNVTQSSHLFAFIFIIQSERQAKKNENSVIYSSCRTVKKIHVPIMWIGYGVKRLIISTVSMVLSSTLHKKILTSRR